MKNFYVYIYLDPRKPGRYIYGSCCFGYEPFYVGKGSKNRYKAHLYDKTKHPKNQKIQKILKEDYNIEEYIIIIPCYSEQDAFKLEINLINMIGRQDFNKGSLLNLTDGGTGTLNKNKNAKYRCSTKGMLNKKHTKETKAKMSKSHKGKKISIKTKAKMSKSKIGNKPWNKGSVMSAETKDKLRKKRSEESINKMKESFKKRKYINICKKCSRKFEAKSNRKYFCEECSWHLWIYKYNKVSIINFMNGEK